MKYRITVSYDGRGFSGYQYQPGRRTVQGELTAAAEKLFGGSCQVTGCSRTDAGVHATGFVATVETESGSVPPCRLPYALNALLPPDISVKEASEAAPSFHPRYDAKGKRYRYLIYDGQFRDPLMNGRAWQVHRRLDPGIMRIAAEPLAGEHNFAAFRAAGAKDGSPVRTVYGIDVAREGDIVSVDVTGNGFLYNMVRIIVGTLAYVSWGKLTAADVAALLESGDRKSAGITAPAEGLYLTEVYY